MYMEHVRIDPGQGHEAGRALLSRMYSRYYGGQMPDILLEEGGKPYFATGHPHFSISHTKAHVFCVLSDTPVGIDAEEMDRQVDLRLADRILSPAEKARYHWDVDKRAALLKMWVLKEADAKHTGKGIHGFPNKTDFDPNDPRIQEIDGCYVVVIGGDYVV